jgi:hypothetical protein
VAGRAAAPGRRQRATEWAGDAGPLEEPSAVWRADERGKLRDVADRINTTGQFPVIE